MEDKRTIILKLAAQGMNSSQIARETGISPGSVYYYMHPEKYKKQEIPLDYRNPDARPGWNADRKKCRSCRYRARPDQVNGCDYIEYAKHSRGCDVEDCDRYVRGKRLKVFRKNMHDSGCIGYCEYDEFAGAWNRREKT